MSFESALVLLVVAGLALGVLFGLLAWEPPEPSEDDLFMAWLNRQVGGYTEPFPGYTRKEWERVIDEYDRRLPGRRHA